MQQTSGWVRVAIVLWSAMGVWLLALWGLTWLALEERAQRTDWATAWQQVAPLWGLCWVQVWGWRWLLSMPGCRAGHLIWP